MTRHRRSISGYTLIEVLTTVCVLGIVLAAALPHLDPRRQDLETTMQSLLGDLRFARAKAISSGVHYSVSRTDSGHYNMNRHRDGGDGTWPVDSVVKTINLPSTVQFWMWPDNIEFNTRGMLVAPAFPVVGIIGDLATSTWHGVDVWPSGQVNQAW